MFRLTLTENTLWKRSTVIRFNKRSFLCFFLTQRRIVINFWSLSNLLLWRCLLSAPRSLLSLFSFCAFEFFSVWRFVVFWTILRSVSSSFNSFFIRWRRFDWWRFFFWVQIWSVIRTCCWVSIIVCFSCWRFVLVEFVWQGWKIPSFWRMRFLFWSSRISFWYEVSFWF